MWFWCNENAQESFSTRGLNNIARARIPCCVNRKHFISSHERCLHVDRRIFRPHFCLSVRNSPIGCMLSEFRWCCDLLRAHIFIYFSWLRLESRHCMSSRWLEYLLNDSRNSDDQKFRLDTNHSAAESAMMELRCEKNVWAKENIRWIREGSK